MLNTITVMGRLTADPELRHTGNNIPVASFTLAVDRDYKDKASGEKQTDFIPVVAWRNSAEFAAKYFSKGRMAVVSGSLQMRKWTDKDGNKRVSAEILAEHIYFGDSKRDGDSAPATGGTYYGGNQSNTYGGGVNVSGSDYSDYGPETLGDDEALPF